MSEGSRKLFGTALAKAKRLARIANISGKKENSGVSISSGLCDYSASVSNVHGTTQDFVENPSSTAPPLLTDNVSHVQPPLRDAFVENVPPVDSSEGSPFLGFSPVGPLHSRQFFKSTPVLSDDNKPFFGFSPQQEFTLKRRSANFGAHPIYSTDLQMTPILSKRQSLSVDTVCPSVNTNLPVDNDAIVDPNLPVDTDLPVDNDPIVDTAPIVDNVPVVDYDPIVDTGPIVDTDPIVDSDPIVDTAPIVDTDPIVDTAPMDHIVELPPVRPFFKIVLGTLCQFSPVFPEPNHQCAAMAATALAYDTIKSVENWNTDDIDFILRTGQKYYEETLLNLEINNAPSHHGFLETAELNETLTIGEQNFQLQCDLLNSFWDSYYSVNVLKGALSHFEMNDFAYGIITYAEYSYGLLRCHNASDNIYYYVFFDSHGRQENGSKVVDREYMTGNAAILFFHNANDFIHFFLEQFPLREANPHHVLHDNLILVPVAFLNDRPPIQQDYFTQYDREDLSQEDELRFEVLYGTNCEYDGFPLAHNHHPCCATVLFSFVYSTLHLITAWNVEDFSAILEYGNIFHRQIYDQEITDNMEYDATVPLLPHQFEGDVELENKKMKLIVSDSDFTLSFNKPNIRNAIAHFESFDNAFGLLKIKDFYYGIVVLLMGSNRRYALFDSHGRRSDGFGEGPHCAVLIFPDIGNIVNFVYAHCSRDPTFTIYPVQIAPISDVLTPEPGHTQTQYEPFIKVIADVGIESDIDGPEQHTFCLALCVIALSSMYVHGMHCLADTSLSYIFESGISYFHMCNERANGTLTNISDYATGFGMEGVDYNMCFDGISATRHSKTLAQLTRNLAYFYDSIIYEFAILKMGDHHYAIGKYKESRNIVFYDVHGRTEIGVRPGNLSTAIYFEGLDRLIDFIKNENHDFRSSTVYCIRFVPSREANRSSLHARYVSGAFAQDAVRFDSKSRDTQCTANSVVFLAFASIIETYWMGCDVDSILELGDHIYTASFADALANGPRNNTFLAAHEIRPNIFVNVSRLNLGVIKVKCVAVSQTDFYGNGQFGRDGQQRIDLFFRHYKYGVLICCARSVGLYKFEDQFVLFEPHPRSADGKLEPGGTAKIFFFTNIPSLFQFISRFGYGQTSEFSLTPFVVTQLDENLKDRRKNVPLPSHRRPCVNELNDEDSFDDIPMRGSDDWSPLDDIPLNQLNDSSDDNVPLIGLVDQHPHQSSVPGPTSVKSLPIIRTKAERDRDKKRNQVKKGKQTQKLKLLTPDERDLRRRWNLLQQKLRRTHTPNIYGNYDNYVEWFYTHREDGSDDEIVEAAVNAQNEYEREEQTRLLRLQNNAAIATHFHAFGNHEEINDTEPMYELYKLSPMNLTCPHCGALYFKEECNARNVFTLCCNSGQIHSELPQKQARDYPHILRDLLLNQSPLSKHFLDNIMLFNNVLSFASLGTTTVHHMQARGSLGPVVAMEGMIYHIAEQFHTNSTGEDMPTAQLYYIDSSVAVAERRARAGVTLNVSLLRSLENFMRANNPLAGAYRMLKDVLDEVKERPNAANTNVHLQIVRNRDQIRIRQNHGGDFAVPTSNEVAVVYTDLPSAASKNIIVFPVDQTPEEGIPLASHDPNRDAMMYPILFPFSEQTWSYTLRRRTKEEVAALNAPPEEAQESEVETTESEPENEPQSEPEDDGRESRRPKKRVRITVREFFTFLLMMRVAFSPLLSAGKLTQQFIIDAYSRAQDNTFEYLMSDRGQAQIRAETYGALKDYIDRKKVFQPDLPGKLIVMPNDIVGSRQYMKRRYADALSMVARYGKPTFFITMTCNPMWEEITKRIPKGTNPVDRPDVVARVFRAKVKELINDISKKHVLGRCVAYLAVIEWQKRSLPHCHLVTFNAPEDKPATHVDIDNFVSAEIPSPNGNTARLYDYVTTYMYHHRCDDTTRRESCRIPRKGSHSCPRHPKHGEQLDTTKDCICFVCSKHFPHNYSSKSELIEGGYPKYRRRMNGRKFMSSRNQEIDNRWIVPYNPYLLLKYNCHINVEITSSLKSIKYLFKYLHKGLDMARLNISVIDNVQVYNEFEHFLDCRYLSAGESIWKLFAYDMFYQSHTIYSLPVHLENYQNVTFHPENVGGALEHTGSHLTAYFELNSVDERARQFFYADIPLYYVYNTKTKKWTWCGVRYKTASFSLI